MEKSSGNTIKIFSSRMQARLLLVFCVITLFMVAVMGRLIYITQVDGERYAKKVLSSQVLSKQTYAVLPFKRGEILDRDGTVLARSELNYRLILDPKLLLQYEDCIDPTLKALKDNFNIDSETLQAILNDRPDSQYVILLKDLKYEAVENYKTQTKDNDKILGVTFEETYVRTYPYNTLACDILGFSSADNTGYYGIEEYYNDVLNGTNGKEYSFYDPDLNIERITKKALNGNSVISTIDADVQRIIQEQIIKFNTDFGSKNIGIFVMNPNNGDILGMASNKEYNLNDPRNLKGIYTDAELSAMTDDQKMEALNTLWKNDAIGFGYEPGSTFKPFTVSAALEENLVSENSTFLCDGGEQVGSDYIHCNKRTGHGELDLGHVLMLSCNDALMQIAGLEGKDVFYDYQTGFGFGHKTGIDLPGEEAGIIIDRDNIGPSDLATSSFGQTFTVTMVQMAAAFSSLVNGGSYYQPHVVKEIVSDSGATIKKFDKVLVKQTVSEKTSEFIQNYMYQTVETGTAGGAKVAGYSIGGKTGTAQKFPRAAKTYLVSFLGCAPAINPEVVIYVIVDEPQNVEKQANSAIATEFAGRILNEILPVLGIYPDGDIDYLLPTQDPAENGDTDTGVGTDTEQSDGAQTDNNAGQADTAQNDSTEGQNGTEPADNIDGQTDNDAGQTDNSGQGGTQEDNPEADVTTGDGSDTQDTNGTGNGTEDDSGENTGNPEDTAEDEFNPDALE